MDSINTVGRNRTYWNIILSWLKKIMTLYFCKKLTEMLKSIFNFFSELALCTKFLRGKLKDQFIHKVSKIWYYCQFISSIPTTTIGATVTVFANTSIRSHCVDTLLAWLAITPTFTFILIYKQINKIAFWNCVQWNKIKSPQPLAGV